MLIGISGLAGSGKDTCADFLVRNKSFVKVALADPLKRIARDVFDFTDEQLWGPSSSRNAPDERYPREHGPSPEGRCLCCGFGFDLYPMSLAVSAPQCYLTPRYALQQLGTEWGRHCYDPVWIEYALRVADDVGREGGAVVTSDLRFKNEIDAYRKAGAFLIRVVRPGAGLGGSAGQHVSETEQACIPDEAFDAVIVNDGTLEELEKKILAVVAAPRACAMCGVSIPDDGRICVCGRCIVERS